MSSTSSFEVTCVLWLLNDENCRLTLIQEVLAVYLNQYPDSATALNLKACNHFRLYNGKAAEVFYTILLCLWTM